MEALHHSGGSLKSLVPEDAKIPTHSIPPETRNGHEHDTSKEDLPIPVATPTTASFGKDEQGRTILIISQG